VGGPTHLVVAPRTHTHPLLLRLLARHRRLPRSVIFAGVGIRTRDDGRYVLAGPAGLGPELARSGTSRGRGSRSLGGGRARPRTHWRSGPTGREHPLHARGAAADRGRT